MPFIFDLLAQVSLNTYKSDFISWTLDLEEGLESMKNTWWFQVNKT